MTEPTPLDALRARGIPVTLATGEVVPLRYSMDSLAQIEQEYGNLGALMAVMRDAEHDLTASMAVADGDATDEQRAHHEQRGQNRAPALFSTIAAAILPGLMDAQGTHPRTGQLFYLGDDPAAARRILDPSHLREYVQAFGESFRQAFYAGERPPTDPPVPAAGPTRSPGLSTGTDGGTSGPSSEAAPMLSFGA